MMMMMNCVMVDWWKALSLTSNQDHWLKFSQLQICHATSRIWTCTEAEFSLCRMKLYSSDNHYTLWHVESADLKFKMLDNILQYSSISSWVSFNFLFKYINIFWYVFMGEATEVRYKKSEKGCRYKNKQDKRAQDWWAQDKRVQDKWTPRAKKAQVNEDCEDYQIS